MSNKQRLGQSRTIGPEPNNFSWEISNNQRFEELVFKFLREEIATIDGSVRVIGTQRVGDEGRDIEIHFHQPISLFNRKFLPLDSATWNNPTKIFLECKSTKAFRLDDGFIADASQHTHDEYLAYILVTNATITPYMHYRAVREWEKLGRKFMLVDRYRLWISLFKDRKPCIRDTDLWPNPAPVIEQPSELTLRIQHQRERSHSEHHVQTYMVIANDTNTPQHVSISSAAEVSWHSDLNLEAILAPGEDQVFRVMSRQIIFGADSELSFSVTKNGRLSRIGIVADHSEIILEPPFMGLHHLKIRDDLRQQIIEASEFTIISIEGEAGVGKSRVIQEAFEQFQNGAVQFHSLSCESDTGKFNFSKIFEFVQQQVYDSFNIQHINTSRPIDALNALSTLRSRQVLLLEDLHHCTAEGIREIKELCFSSQPKYMNIVLIITGRNDYTFPNADYFAFLELIRAPKTNLKVIEVNPLTDNETTDLIKSIVIDFPGSAIEKIQKICQNNPFILLEVLQYFLDVKIATLLSGQTIGVADPERLVGLEGLPENVNQIFKLRYNALEASEPGEQASDFLGYLSMLGFRAPIEVIEEYFGGKTPKELLSILRQRRFIQFLPTVGEISFFHENILHTSRNWLKEKIDACASARRILSTAAASRLSPYRRGELEVTARQYSEAFISFRPIWQRICEVTNFSSEEIDREYFQFLPALYDAAKATGQGIEKLGRLAVTRGYMGVHNFPLYQGVKACEQSLKWLNALYPKRTDGRNDKLAIQQLQAHALQNMGHVGDALRLMLELQAELLLDPDISPQVAYDLFDRLQEHYRRANHRILMENYGRLARRAVEKTEDRKLLSAHLITSSLSKAFLGKTSALDSAKEALEVSKEIGVRRFVVFNTLSLLVVRALYASTKLELRNIYVEAKELLRFAALESFSDSIIRLELLIGTLALQVIDNRTEAIQTARKHISTGQDAAARFGVGIYDWALENLRAVTLIEQNSSSKDEIRKAFKGCEDRLQKRGLLFVGTCDGTYPNVHAISNVTRFLSMFGEELATDFLTRKIWGYDKGCAVSSVNVISLAKDAGDGKALFWPHGRVKIMRFPVENGYFTPIF